MAFLEYSPQATLFHYSNNLGFEGILKSKKLWLSDIQSTNDPREINLGKDLLLEAFKQVMHLDFEGHRGMPLSILAGKLSGYLSERRLFSASFCHGGDSLPMWREYGGNGHGYSIGFRSRGLTDMPLRIQKIRYLPDVDAKHFADLLREALKTYSTQEDISSVITNIHVIAPILSAVVSAKHGSWEYEQEIRLSHATDAKGEIHSVNGTAIPNYLYPDGVEYFTEVLSRRVPELEIKYVALPFGKYVDGKHDPSEAIQRIILGPLCSTEPSEVKELVASCGFKKFEVVRSICRLR